MHIENSVNADQIYSNEQVDVMIHLYSSGLKNKLFKSIDHILGSKHLNTETLNTIWQSSFNWIWASKEMLVIVGSSPFSMYICSAKESHFLRHSLKQLEDNFDFFLFEKVTKSKIKKLLCDIRKNDFAYLRLNEAATINFLKSNLEFAYKIK